ncbi:MAG TPA: hypothetical protein VNN80_32630, partial [Polyangiaceae bacterium]|nr:hypothetical protein [Polyangiaceae bacterium]
GRRFDSLPPGAAVADATLRRRGKPSSLPPAPPHARKRRAERGRRPGGFEDDAGRGDRPRVGQPERRDRVKRDKRRR